MEIGEFNRKSFVLELPKSALSLSMSALAVLANLPQSRICGNLTVSLVEAAQMDDIRVFPNLALTVKSHVAPTKAETNKEAPCKHTGSTPFGRS